MSGLFSGDRECRDCHGSGKAYDYKTYEPKDEPCSYCHGTGVQLSEVGRELIDFLKEHYTLTPKGR